jgi:hypothetical protein
MKILPNQTNQPMMTISSPAFPRSRNGLLVPAGLLLVLSLFAPSPCHAQEPQPQKSEKKAEAAPSTSTPAASEDAARATPADAQKPLTLKEAIQRRKVLTEDDLHPQYGRRFHQDAEQHEFNPICTPECEQRVRDALQTDDSSELEFRNKFALATQAIDDDHKWGNAVVEAVHAADDYCGLERNRGQYAYPGATPPYTTDKLNFDFIAKEREVVNKYVMAKGNVDIRIRDMRSTDLFRSVVMQGQWDVALERSCRGVDHI